MKQIILSLIFLFPTALMAQLIVSDPTLEAIAIKESAQQTTMAANTLRQLDEAYKHTSELSKSTDFLKKSYDRLNEVNKFISNLTRLERLISKQQKLINQTSEVVSELDGSDLYSMDELNTLHYSFTKMITSTNDIIDMLDLVLKPKTKMSDAERLVLLRQMEDDFKERQTLMNKTLYEYKRIHNQRIINQTLGAMHAK